DDPGGRGRRRHQRGARQDRHHRRLRLRPHHARRAQRAVPVRRARPGTLLVPVGPAVLRHAGRGRARRHPAHRRLLVRHRPAGEARHAVHRGLQRLRRAHLHPAADPRGAGPGPGRAAGQLRRAVPGVQQDRADHAGGAHPGPVRLPLPRLPSGAGVSPAPRSAPDPDPVRLSGPLLQDDPARVYREMRRAPGSVVPILLDGDIPAWLVLGYRELHQITGDPVLFSRDSDLWNQWVNIPDDLPLLPVIGRKQPSILYTVGERHRQRAGMMVAALEAVDPFELRRSAEKFADELIDGICPEGRADIIAEYAMLLPVRVLTRLYGFTDDQGPALVTALNDMIDGRERAIAGQTHLFTSMTELVALRREQPADDVVTRMLADTSGFTDEEIVQD